MVKLTHTIYVALKYTLNLGYTISGFKPYKYMKLMPDCDENMALRYVMPKKSRDEHNR